MKVSDDPNALSQFRKTLWHFTSRPSRLLSRDWSRSLQRSLRQFNRYKSPASQSSRSCLSRKVGWPGYSALAPDSVREGSVCDR